MMSEVDSAGRRQRRGHGACRPLTPQDVGMCIRPSGAMQAVPDPQFYELRVYGQL
jgi:hypothetical protein